MIRGEAPSGIARLWRFNGRQCAEVREDPGEYRKREWSVVKAWLHVNLKKKNGEVTGQLGGS